MIAEVVSSRGEIRVGKIQKAVESKEIQEAFVYSKIIMKSVKISIYLERVILKSSTLHLPVYMKWSVI